MDLLRSFIVGTALYIVGITMDTLLLITTIITLITAFAVALGCLG